MQKDIIIQKLKAQGCRITKQRLILLDIILDEECASCKEIYFKASQQDKRIGTATVYRMINMLEEIGAIDRRNMYRIAPEEKENKENVCIIEFEDHTILRLTGKKWSQIVLRGLEACGYDHEKKMIKIQMSGSGIIEPIDKIDKNKQ